MHRDTDHKAGHAIRTSDLPSEKDRAPLYGAKLFIITIALLLIGLSDVNAQTPPKPIKIELNKLEAREGACRTYFVMANGSEHVLTSLGLDIFIFDKQKIIMQRVGPSISRLQPHKTRVVLFDIPDVDCANVGAFLLNGVTGCKDGNGADIPDCGNLLEIGSRAEVAFVE
jgi:hypothetical protein